MPPFPAIRPRRTIGSATCAASLAGHTFDLTLSTLKGHLLIEEQLDNFITARLPNPGALEGARLTFDLKIKLAHAIASEDRPEVWLALRKLNKLRNSLARKLDDFGMHYIEGGWPGSNPKDMEFFERAQRELNLKQARIAAFGSTCRAGSDPTDDPQVRRRH